MSLGIGAWGGRNLVQTVRDAGDRPMTVSAVQCLVGEDSRDPGFVANVTLRTESVERLEATHYGPSFFDDERPRRLLRSFVPYYAPFPRTVRDKGAS